ncbi:hypothetical protein PG993_005540 [Apiospora rasikravindrae]|uniref:Uncharacterized protein n=1 Tax=Apiospora rasikravindrae TaxID=990691 RepID=A0ABR1THS0_9PEZI
MRSLMAIALTLRLVPRSQAGEIGDGKKYLLVRHRSSTAANTGCKRKTKAMKSAALADNDSDGDDVHIVEMPSKKAKTTGIKTEKLPFQQEDLAKGTLETKAPPAPVQCFAAVPTGDVDKHLENLVSLFLSHPEVATHVRHLAIRMPDSRAPREESTVPTSRVPVWSPRQLRLFRGAFEDDDEDEDEDDLDAGSVWSTTDESEEEIEGGDEEEASNEDMSGKLSQKATEVQRWVILVILLTRLTKLKTLDLEFTQPAYCGEIFDMILRFNERAISARLPTVDRICFGYSSVPARGLLCDGIFSFPGLTSVYLHRVTSGASMTFLGEPYTLPFKHLELRDCRLSPPELSNIVKSAKCLESFIYEVGEPRTTYQRRQNISYRSIRLALESQKDNLKSIWVDYPHDYLFDELSTDETRPIGSFREYKALRRLRIAGTYIFGFVWTDNLDTSRLVRALPEQIEAVHVTHADEDEETVEGCGRSWMPKPKAGSRRCTSCCWTCPDRTLRSTSWT